MSDRRPSGRTLITVTGPLRPIGGIARSSLELSREVHSLGWDIVCLFPEGGELEDEWHSFATLRQIPRLHFSAGHPLDAIRTLRGIEDIQIKQPAVVHAHKESHYEFAWVLSRLLKVGYVAHLRADPMNLSRRLVRAARAADLRIAVSDPTREVWRNEWGVDGTVVVPNGVDLGSFSGWRTTTTRASDPFRILFVGRTEPDKGIDLALKAFEIAADQLPTDSVLEVVGSSRNTEHLKWFGSLLDAVRARNVRWLQETKDVRPALSQADVLVIPSRREAFGRVAVEAMAMGVPIVATRVGGLAAVVGNERPNRLVPPEEPHALAEALIAASRSRPFTARDRSVLRSSAARYSLTACATRTVELLDPHCRWPGQQ